MTLRQRRVALWIALGVLVAAGLAYAFAPRPVPVDLVTVERGPLTVTLDEEGETRVRDVFVLSAPVAGRARRIEVEVGDLVTGGESVVTEIEPIDPSLLDVRSEREARAAVQAAVAARELAEAELDRARAELDFARSERARQQGLAARGIASQRERDTAERAFRTARAALETARAAVQARSFEVDRARARLVTPGEVAAAAGECACIGVRAPVSGVVLRVLHESEGVVAAGEPLVEIGDPSDLEVLAELLSPDAVRVRAGMPVWIEQWGGAERLVGRVRRVEPYGFTKVSALGIEEQRVNVLIDLVDPAEQWLRLGHGYRVEARIVLWQADDVVKAPLSALFREGDGWAVFAQEDGRARLRPVSRGRHDGLEAEIREGLAPGDVIVRYPSERVGDGTRIAPRG